MVCLNGQGDQLRGAHTHVQETRAATAEAHGILRKMARQAAMNKVLLWCIIIILIAANIAVVYFKYIKKKDTPAPAPTPPPPPPTPAPIP